MSKAGGSQAQLQAIACCMFMRKRKYQPATLISVGVGTAPELSIWQWLLPNTRLLGIDPRRSLGHWPKDDYHEVAAGDGSVPTLHYCRNCRATQCDNPQHPRRGTVPVVTIDSIAANYPAPYFLWMDCEGAELAALNGATETLKRTRWMSLEFRDFAWDGKYAESLNDWLTSRGYSMYYQGQHLDRLYWRRRFIA